MRKLIILIGCFGFIIYWSFAFVLNKLNPMEWLEGTRVFFCICNYFIIFISFGTADVQGWFKKGGSDE